MPEILLNALFDISFLIDIPTYLRLFTHKTRTSYKIGNVILVKIDSKEGRQRLPQSNTQLHLAKSHFLISSFLDGFFKSIEKGKSNSGAFPRRERKSPILLNTQR